MDISYNDLKSKEIINLSDGTKMGHIIDIIFDSETSKVSGIIVPGEKRLFRKNDDLFISLEKIRKIGDDVILIRFENQDNCYKNLSTKEKTNKFTGDYVSIKTKTENGSFIRYKRLDNKKYK